MGFSAGIDIGGTKIEATLFDQDYQPLASQRVETPKQYQALLQATLGQLDWLQGQAKGADIAIGIGIPGLHNSQTGLSKTANLAADGKPFRADLQKAYGTDLTFGNDCDLFTYSEAVLGAGKGYKTVFGLVMGTGTGGGVCHAGRLAHSPNGSVGEVGHLGISAAIAQEFDLPLLHCGCGRVGCYETLTSGPGMARLAGQIMGADLDAREIMQKVNAGDADAKRVLHVWSHLLASLIGNLQLTIDPDCVVLGGGLSKIPDIAQMIARVLPQRLLKHTTAPQILIAKYGDSSGTRGAALAAVKRGEA